MADVLEKARKGPSQSMACRASHLREISANWDDSGLLSKQHLCPAHFSNQLMQALRHLSRVVDRQEGERLLEDAVAGRRQRKGFREGTDFVTFTDVMVVMQQKGEPA
jgi:hypothetical protein